MEGESLYLEIQRILSNEPELSFSLYDLLTSLKKRTQDRKKEAVIYSTFSVREEQFPVLVERMKKSYFIPLFTDYYKRPGDLTWVMEGKHDITFPVRSTKCKHADVLDYLHFLNELKTRGKEDSKEAKEANGSQVKCPFCTNTFEVTSLYLDTRVYRAMQKKPDAIMVSIPKLGEIGYDPEMATAYTLNDLRKMNCKVPGTLAL